MSVNVETNVMRPDPPKGHLVNGKNGASVVEEMEETQERTDSFMEQNPAFAQAMPEVVIPQEATEHSYEDSFSSTTEEETKVPASQFE